jgi:purine-binding chemotaxis protein CheW
MSGRVKSRGKTTRKRSATPNRAKASDAQRVPDKEPERESVKASVAVQEAEGSAESVYAFADTLQEREESTSAERGPVERPETFVTFHLAEEIYGLPVSEVREILRVSSITRVPHAPACVRGITNMRGHVLPVFDCRERLGLPPADPGAESRILVVGSGNRMVGLLVDAAHKVVTINSLAIQKPPADVMSDQSDYIMGVYRQEDQLFILLDLHRVLMLGERAAQDSTGA